MNAERIGYLTAKLLQSWSMGMVPLMDEDIDDLLSILDDYEKAKAESSLYLERSIEMGFKVKDLMAELEKAKVELSHAKEVAEGAGYRLQKAEAALLGTQVVSAKNGAVIAEQMVELARYAPLIDAAEKSCPEYLQGELMDLRRMKVKYEDEILSEAIPILRAALACREPEREKKEGSLTLENATEVAEKTARELNNSRVVTDDQLKKRVTI